MDFNNCLLDSTIEAESSCQQAPPLVAQKASGLIPEDLIINQLTIFERHDQEKNELIKKLYREMQQVKEDLNKKSAEIAKDRESGHVLVILDGNSCMFREELWAQGAIGGSTTANRLVDAIHEHTQQHDGYKQPIIQVRVYINFEHLEQKLRGNSLGQQLLRQFAWGFTQSQPFFDIIDVGNRAPEVSAKIEAVFKLSLSNGQFGHILLGKPLDQESGTLLANYKNSVLNSRRVTALKTNGSQVDYNSLPFIVAEFPSVFESFEPIVTRFPEVLSTPSPTLVLAKVPPSIEAGPSKIKRPVSSLSVAVSTKAPHQSRGSGASKNLRRKDSLTFKPRRNSNPLSLEEPFVSLNIEDKRIDPDLGIVDLDVAARLNVRAMKQNLCNDFHLKFICKAEKCQYGHEPRLSLEETTILKSWARRLPCRRLSACRTATCWYGHMCPYENCPNPSTCKFKAVHNLDKRIVNTYSKPRKTLLI